MRTSRLTLRFTPLQTPLQVSDVVIPGVAPLRAPSVPFRLPCGLGPLIKLNGTVLATRVSGTFTDLLTGRPVRFAACPQATIAAGANRVVEPAGDAFDVQDVVLAGGGGQALSAAGSAPAAPAFVRSWTSSRRVLEVIAVRRSYLVVNENFNPGWRASAGGRQLRPVRLDGWQQAWLLPAGTAGAVTLTYVPDALYRDAILGGLGTLLLVMLVAAWPGARGRRLRVPVPKLGGGCGAAREAAAPGAVAPTRSRRLRLRPGTAAAMTLALIACGLLLAGFWLGGYPGALILIAATCLFVTAISNRRAHRFWLELSRPWVLTGLLLVAAACGAVGNSGPLLTGLWNAVPQVICLIIVGRLVAALILPDP